MEEAMTEEIKVHWRDAGQVPASRALLIVETEQTTLRKVEFDYLDRNRTRQATPVGWVLSYWYGVNRRQLTVPKEKIKRWAYETDESLAALDQFATDMVVDTFKTTIENLERRIAGASHELEKKLPSVTAEVELTIHNALRHLSGEVEREERARR
jgi:hypothetical protein